MRIGILRIGVAAFVFTGVRPAAAADEAAPFSVAHARFEQNATDGDVEAIFEVIGRKDGMTKLKVVAPNGHTIIEFSVPNGPKASGNESTMGIRQFTFESPEPTDVEGLKASYPAGEYNFTGETAKGATLQSKAKLTHALPQPTSFVFPKRDAKDVPTKNVQIKWESVKGVEGYAIELEGEEAGSTLEIKLPAKASSFSVPDGFLAPGQEYQLGIGTVSTDGNISYVEMNFTTADK